MSRPALGKCTLFLVIVLLIYTGYAFRIRDGGLLASSEQPHGTCNSVTGKCPGKSVVGLNLPYKKYQSLSSIGKLTKLQSLLVENKQSRIIGKTEKLAAVKVEHGLRKLKVSRFETSTSEAEPGKGPMDDMNDNGEDEIKGEERKNNKSEEGEERDEKGAEKVESAKEDDDDQEKEGEGTAKNKIIDYDFGSNANENEGRKNVSDESFQQKTHKHAFKLKDTRLLKKLLDSPNLSADQFSSNDSNVDEKNQAEIDNKVNDNQDNENLKHYDNENDDNNDEYKKINNEADKDEQVVMLTLASRKLETVRLADKWGGESTVRPDLEPEISTDKPTDVHILNNDSEESNISKSTQISELERPEPKLAAKVEKRANASEKEDTSKSEPKSPSTLKTKLISSERSKHIADTKKTTKPESECIFFKFTALCIFFNGC